MPWELTVVNYEGESLGHEPCPLGSAEQVRSRISACLPEVVWREEAPPLAFVMRLLELDPNNQFYRRQIESMSEEEKARKSRPRITGRYKTADFSLEFIGCNAGDLQSFSIHIRGDGNPLPVLSKICLPFGWSVREDDTGNLLDLGGPLPEQWENFRKWRDRILERKTDL